MAFVGKITGTSLDTIAKRLEGLKKPITRKDAEEVGDGVVTEMKNLITKGVSPIEGNGRFEGYKNPKKYPGKRKPKTPVNLTLSGDFLDALSYSTVQSPSGYGTKIFYQGSKENKKEEGHREGANGQKKRPTIPLNGETFAARIQRVFAEIYNKRINILSKGGT
jgi:hypothetical protein